MASRSQAQAAIGAGRVRVAGTVAANPSRLVAAGEALVLTGPPPRYVSRGGEKLAGALARFEIDVHGCRALDAGASTGGFTDCLLQSGAAEVIAIDVGRGQLHERLRANPRVRALERTDIRAVTLPTLEGRAVDVVVADLSFISLGTVAPVLAGRLAGPGAVVVVLVKPQFEAGRAEASKGRGVIRDPRVWRAALHRAEAAFSAAGAATIEAMPSPLRGADGNVEFFLYFRAHTPASGQPVDLDRTVTEALADRN